MHDSLTDKRVRTCRGSTEAEPEYAYPTLDVDIVANIVRALSEVPQYDAFRCVGHVCISHFFTY
jgi:hypothetical protein